ncbi:MAG TPA: hypothetical protein VFG73_08515 [Rhodanobacteraceae bacterium]|nr:hypothetical protein [Rhodanobacteraceae bacterium]
MKTQGFGLATLLAAGLIGGCVGVGASNINVARAADGPQSITVFVDATYGFRKDHMARQLTRSHEEYAAKGYHVVDLSLYDENGDMEGFFVTYAR